MVQALSEAKKVKRIEFALGQMETDDLCVSNLVFSDDVLISEKIQHERDFSKVSIFCGFSNNKVFGPFFQSCNCKWVNISENVAELALPST